MKRFLTAYPWYLVYADDPSADPPVVDPPADPVADPPPAPADKNKVFNQDEVNKILTEDRKKLQSQVNKTVKELEDLKKSKTLTEREKTTLQSRIDELQNSMLTKEQLAAKEREKLETTHKQTVHSLTSERDAWQNRFITSQINQAIVSESVKAGAIDDADIIDKLHKVTRLVEETDEEGKGLGSFMPKVKFADTDQEGKPITLEFTVEQAVKRMKEMPKYAHLFKSTAGGGLGADSGTGKGQKKDIKDMTPEQWRKQRKELGYTRKGFGQ